MSRRSGQEVALDAEEGADHVLILEGGNSGRMSTVRPQSHAGYRAEGGRVAEALVGRIQVVPRYVDADVEIGMRIPLRARADLPPTEIGRAGIAEARPDAERRLDDAFHRHAAGRGAGRGRRQVLVDQV